MTQGRMFLTIVRACDGRAWMPIEVAARAIFVPSLCAVLMSLDGHCFPKDTV